MTLLVLFTFDCFDLVWNCFACELLFFLPWEFLFALVGVYFLVEINLIVGLFVGIVSPHKIPKILAAYMPLKDAISTNRIHTHTHTNTDKKNVHWIAYRKRQIHRERATVKMIKKCFQQLLSLFFCGFSGIKFYVLRTERPKPEHKRNKTKQQQQKSSYNTQMFVFLLRN